MSKRKKIVVFFGRKKEENDAVVSVKTVLVLIKARNRFEQKTYHIPELRDVFKSYC